MSELARDWQKDLFDEIPKTVITKEKVDALPAAVATFFIVLISLVLLRPPLLTRAGKPFEKEEFNWVAALGLSLFAGAAVWLWTFE